MTILDVINEHEKTRTNSKITYIKSNNTTIIKSYHDVVKEAKQIAAYLQSYLPVQSRVLLVYYPGIDFITAFLGCLYAGMIAVPAYPLQNARNAYRLQTIIDSSKASLILGSSKAIDTLEPIESIKSIEKIKTPEFFMSKPSVKFHIKNPINPQMIAFLQYTSGSTGLPKGVMVTHANLLDNLQSIKQASSFNENLIALNWLPFQHDFGLIAGYLSWLFNAYHLITLSPVSAIQKPYLWLKALSDYKANLSSAPNFVFQRCVDTITPDEIKQIDLSSVKAIIAAAEPNRYETVHAFCQKFKDCGFDESAYTVGYGLAEATLQVTSNPFFEPSKHVRLSRKALSQGKVASPENDSDCLNLMSAGRLLPQHTVAIVHVKSHTLCPSQQIGEIWIKSKSVTKGYWDNPKATKAIYHQKIIGQSGEYLNTGDLGFIKEGELYVTGREKDILIINGRNIYPQDLETAVEASHEYIAPHGSAAFSIEVNDREEVVICAEIKRTALKKDLTPVIRAIRHALASEAFISPYAIKLLKPGHSFKTTSGKIKRQPTKEAFIKNTLVIVADDSLI